MLAKNIQKIRKQKGITLDRLAKLADMPFTTLCKIESGKIRQPGIGNVVKIAGALKVKIDKLVNG